MTQIIYNSRWFDTALEGTDDETFGVVGALISAAPGIFSAIAGLFGGGRKAQCQGSAEIQSCGQQAITAMNQILQGLAAGQMSPDQAVAEASRIVGQFNDPSIVYPAKKGNDAAIRQQFIQQLSALQQQVQQAAATAAAQSPQQQNNILSNGISPNTFLLLGGGLAALFLLRR